MEEQIIKERILEEQIMEEQEMKTQEMKEANPAGTKRTHKVGTVTLGIILVLFGSLFLAHIFIPTLTYDTIWHLWPCALISLGIEVLLSTFQPEKARYDGWGIVLVFLITIFSMCMAGIEWIFHYWDWVIYMPH